MHKIRLLLLDDHILIREGLTRLLATEEEVEIVAQCGTTSEAVSLLESHAIDLVLLDFDLVTTPACPSYLRQQRQKVRAGFY